LGGKVGALAYGSNELGNTEREKNAGAYKGWSGRLKKYIIGGKV